MMRSPWSFVCAFAILVACTSCPATAQRYALSPRQDSSPSTTADVASQSSVPSDSTNSASTSLSDGLSTSATPSPQTSADDSATKSLGASTSLVPTTSARSSSSSPTTTAQASSTSLGNTGSSNTANGTAIADSDRLPLRPTITPALSVAGAILIVSGTIYTLIGIKSKWVHIFLSAAYLTSLAITVLVLYVMNPPISNAVQGAYLVAAVLPGVLFGVGSIIFQDVTECLGCILGGFCLSMWLLVLKPGGIIASTGGKAIFIGVFSLAVFALYFSHYTRPYAIIGSTSFAGATAIVLGIDCFSRAGLKEFWMYIWALNDNIFPLLTVTYPITRGIRVEIACTVLLSLIGIMSQMKIWKVVKEKREKKALERKEEDERRDQAEEELGRRLEEGNERERAQWETVYGNKGSAKRQHVDSGIGTEDTSLRKHSMSVVEAREVRGSRIGSIEMDNLQPSKRSSQESSGGARYGAGSRITRVAEDDDIHEISAGHRTEQDRFGEQYHGPRNGADIRNSTIMSGNLPSNAHLSEGTSAPEGHHLQSRASYLPEVVSLPFKVPMLGNYEEDDDKSSVATFASSARLESRLSKRLSGASLLKSFSKLSHRHSLLTSTSKEALVVPSTEEHKPVSTAVNTLGPGGETGAAGLSASEADHIPRKVNYSRPRNSLTSQSGMVDTYEPIDNGQPLMVRKPGDSPPAPMTTMPNSATETSTPWYATRQIGYDNPEAAVKESSIRNHLNVYFEEKPLLSATDNEEGAEIQSKERPKSVKSAAASEASGRPSSRAGLEGRLPEDASKVVLAYRTNEWAKHLDRAEKPEPDDIRLSRAIEDPEAGQTIEAAAPVHIAELQQTSAVAQSPVMGSQRRQNYLDQLPGTRPPWDLPKTFLARSQVSEQPESVDGSMRSSYDVPRATSQVSFQNAKVTNGLSQPGSTRLPSQQSLLATRAVRSSSTPLVGTPIEEGIEAKFSSRFTPLALPNNTLLAQRDSILKNKHSFQSSDSSNPSPAEFATNLASISSTSPYNHGLNALEDDNISLSQRKSLLSHQHQYQQYPTSFSPVPQSVDPRISRRSVTDPSQRRASQLAAFRTSLQSDFVTSQVPHLEAESRRAEMLNEKYRASWMQQQQAAAASMRMEAMDREMRRADMKEAHREGIRRMQAEANRHLSSSRE